MRLGLQPGESAPVGSSTSITQRSRGWWVLSLQELGALWENSGVLGEETAAISKSVATACSSRRCRLLALTRSCAVLFPVIREIHLSTFLYCQVISLSIVLSGPVSLVLALKGWQLDPKLFFRENRLVPPVAQKAVWRREQASFDFFQSCGPPKLS